MASELCPLVRINDVRSSVPANSTFYDLKDIASVQSIGEFPSYDKPAEDINYGNLVHKSLAHADIGYIYAPYLVRPFY